MRKRLFLLIFCVNLILLSGCQSAATSAPRISSTATNTPAPTRAATPAPGAVTVSDSAIAGQLSFAFVQANDVWVSWRGAAPQQVTHLNLSAQQLAWNLVWSADQTKLLATEGNSDPGGASQAGVWIISLAEETITPLPTLSPVTAGCVISCGWLDDRYLVYMDVAQTGSHAQVYHIYDTQRQRTLSTSMDNLRITEWEARDDELYFTPYIDSVDTDNFVPGAIKRFDLASNRITTAFTVSEGALVIQGLSSAHWDLSADGKKIIYYFFGGALHGCPSGIQCKTIYQDSAGRITAIFPSYQASVNATTQINGALWISPDGNHAAGFISAIATIIAPNPPDTLVQQTLPSGSAESNALPAEDHPYSDRVLGWISHPAGIVVQRIEEDAQDAPLASDTYFAPLGSNAAHLVETVQASVVAFASLG
jgi:hypothetical protein